MQEKKSISERFTLFLGSFLNFSFKTIRGNLLVGICLLILGLAGGGVLIFEESPEELQSQIARYEQRKSELENITSPSEELQIELQELSLRIRSLSQEKQTRENFLKTPQGKLLDSLKVPSAVIYILGGILFNLGFFRGFISLVGYPFRKNTLQIENIRLQGEIERLQSEIETTKKPIRPAWSRAQNILEKYYDRNLIQIQQIFYTSIVVMILGFCLIAFPVLFPRRYESVIVSEERLELNKGGSTLDDSQGSKPENSGQTNNSRRGISENNFILLLTVISGIVTEFIGATFLVIYRSTINQSIKYTEALQRDNLVSMAMDILSDLEVRTVEELEREMPEKVVNAKIAIATLLIGRKPDDALDILQNKDKDVQQNEDKDVEPKKTVK